MYKDDNRNVKPHTIKKGDQVLMRQNMTKTQSRYDPRPFKVDEVHGSQITVSRDGSKKTRDAQKLKKVKKSTENCYIQQRCPRVLYADNDIDYSVSTNVTSNNNTQTLIEATQVNNQAQTNGRPATTIQRRQSRTGDYPNGHLDPNIDINLPRSQRSRQKPEIYQAGL